MFTEDEKIAVAGHDGRRLPRNRGSEDSVVVSISRHTFEV
jgi:hypothetical protein